MNTDRLKYSHESEMINLRKSPLSTLNPDHTLKWKHNEELYKWAFILFWC